jgi:hypothetical protein
MSDYSYEHGEGVPGINFDSTDSGGESSYSGGETGGSDSSSMYVEEPRQESIQKRLQRENGKAADLLKRLKRLNREASQLTGTMNELDTGPRMTDEERNARWALEEEKKAAVLQKCYGDLGEEAILEEATRVLERYRLMAPDEAIGVGCEIYYIENDFGVSELKKGVVSSICQHYSLMVTLKKGLVFKERAYIFVHR